MMFFVFEELKIENDFNEILDPKIYSIDKNKLKNRDFDDIYELYIKIAETLEYEF